MAVTAYTNPNYMAKRKQQDQQLSLFDDSFFDNEATASMPKKSTGKPAKAKLIDQLMAKALEQADKAEREGHVITVSTYPNEEDSQQAMPEHKKTEKIRLRDKRQRIKVTFADGTTICNESATGTMIQAISKIGVERVAALGMEVCHVPLVSTEVVPRYARWTKPIGEGWYLLAQSDTRQKYMQLRAIIDQLGIEASIILGDYDTMPILKGTGSTPKSKKKHAKLEVTMADGNVVCHSDPVHTFVDVLRRIGILKLKKTQLTIAGKPIVTPDKKYNNQVQLPNGEWMTIPISTKDKYKMLRIISAVTHIPIEIKIIE